MMAVNGVPCTDELLNHFRFESAVLHTAVTWGICWACYMSLVQWCVTSIHLPLCFAYRITT